MGPRIFALAQVLSNILRLKLLELTSKFPPLPGGILDEQIELLQSGQALLGTEPVDRKSPAQARSDTLQGMRSLRSLGGIHEKVAAVREISIPGPCGQIPVRLYLPDADQDHPLFVLFHGGGFVTGDLETADGMARFICRRAGFAVLSVDYRLAPEHPFPAALEDCFAALCWAAAHAADCCADPARIMVGGDSAGATLATVVAKLACSQGGPHLAGQVLFYPSSNSAAFDTPSFREFGERSLGLKTSEVNWFLDQYAPLGIDRRDPRLSPLFESDLCGMAPALVVTAEFDVLRDEGEAYARRLEQAGVPVKLIRCNGMIHGFMSMAGLIHRATTYFDQAIGEIRRMAA